MDRALIEQKVESLRLCTQRIHDKCPPLAEDLARDIDAQDSIRRPLVSLALPSPCFSAADWN